VILLAALRDGRISVCDDRCWRATDPRCVCLCLGLCHGVGPEEAARRIATLDLATLAGAVAMPTLPFRAAESLVAMPEPLMATAGPVVASRPRGRVRRPGEGACADCGEPLGGAVAAWLDSTTQLCSDCLARLWRSA